MRSKVEGGLGLALRNLQRKAEAANLSHNDRENTMEATAAVERAARDSYSRLLAFLVARSRDVAAAQDALSDAFLTALETWPHGGVPQKPEAWLLVAARRRLIDNARHQRIQAESLPTMLAVTDEAQELAADSNVFPDERLKLMFVCAHPAIDVAARTPLMLQTVLCLDAARIACAFIVKPSTMGQRLTRAKNKIRDARIAIDVPEPKELPERLDAVLDTIYAAYGTGWDDVTGADERRRGLAGEAIELASLLLKMLPDEPEVLGLLALMLFCEARRAARLNPEGDYVPLSEQDIALWSMPMIEQAEQFLRQAEQANRVGHFQLEAAIQRTHAQRAWGSATNWEETALLYEGLVQLAPTIGALVGRAAAAAQARGASMGWTLLQAIPADLVTSYQPYWALNAHLLKELRRTEESQSAYARAIGLCENPQMRAYLLRNAAMT
jgi:predicted RNA polymerase sigma factor